MRHSTSELKLYGVGKPGVEYSPEGSLRLKVVRGNWDGERLSAVKQKEAEKGPGNKLLRAN